MKTIYIAICAAGLAIVSPGALAQHEHQLATPQSQNVIDGSQHPEQIPDSVAYRLFFIVVSEMPSPTPEAQARQRSFLKQIGLSDGDLKDMIPVLTTFKLEYTNLINEYNQEVFAANESHAQPDLATFKQKLDLLVETTRDSLISALTEPGLESVHAHVQKEKRKMKIAATEVSQ